MQVMFVHNMSDVPSSRVGETLDIDPNAVRDRVGPRRDKGHRYLSFETQVRTT